LDPEDMGWGASGHADLREDEQGCRMIGMGEPSVTQETYTDIRALYRH